MHLYYTKFVLIYVYLVHTHTHTFSTTCVALGVANPTSCFFCFFKNKPIVLFKSFQPVLQ